VPVTSIAVANLECPLVLAPFHARGTGNTDSGLIAESRGVLRLFCTQHPHDRSEPSAPTFYLRLTLILIRIGVVWIAPGEFRISKTPLSIPFVPEFTIRLPLRVSPGLTVLVSPGGTFATPAANRILRCARCARAAGRSLSRRARGSDAKSVTWAVHEVPTPLHVSDTRHRERLHTGGPSSRSRPRADLTGPPEALTTGNPDVPLWATGVTSKLTMAP
jgi:hypothetical protein